MGPACPVVLESTMNVNRFYRFKVPGHPVVCFVLLAVLGAGSASAQDKKERRAYFKKWLEQDVVYIISDEERSVFLKLTTDDEREQFVEQFWLRRDPTPRTQANEFREDHYRRIQYVNERFSSGIPGWKTDRGMMYVKFGPPTQIEAYPSGGHYNRPSWEGGGSTSTYPFEIWRYRNILGVGQDIEIEFVDQTLSGEYAIAKSPWTKDALLHAGGAGPTLMESLGLASKADRIAPKTNPMPDHNPLYFGHGRLKDQPFEKLLLMTNLQRAPQLNRPELRQLVHAEVKYQMLPFDLRSDYLKLDEQKYLVPLTLKILNRNIQYEGKGGVHRSVLSVYGEVFDLAGNLVTSFEDTVTGEITEEQLQAELKRFSLYQKALELPPGRYKLALVLKDENSTKVGTAEHLIVIPRLPESDLSISSLVPALRIENLSADDSPLFAMGPVRVFPDPRAEAKSNGELPVFFQVYNLAIDSASGAPMVEVQYVISRQGKELLRQKDQIQGLNASSISVVKYLPLEGLTPGGHLLEVTVWDAVSKTNTVRNLPFSVIQ